MSRGKTLREKVEAAYDGWIKEDYENANSFMKDTLETQKRTIINLLVEAEATKAKERKELADAIEELEVTNWCPECYLSLFDVGKTTHETYKVTVIRIKGDWSKLAIPSGKKRGDER